MVHFWKNLKDRRIRRNFIRVPRLIFVSTDAARGTDWSPGGFFFFFKVFFFLIELTLMISNKTVVFFHLRCTIQDSASQTKATDLLSIVAVHLSFGHCILQHVFNWLGILHPLNQSHSVTTCK